MNFFPVVILAAALSYYAVVVWRAHRTDRAGEEVIHAKLSVGMFIYMGFGILGREFPLVNRSFPPSGIFSSVDVRTAMVVGLIECICLAIGLRRKKYPTAVSLSAVFYPLVVVFGIGHFNLVNALCDLSRPQWHRVQIVGTNYSPPATKKAARYRAILADWRGAESRVCLDVKETEYPHAIPGTWMEVQTGSGALGAEWVRAYRFLQGESQRPRSKALDRLGF
jgi:hypothetical protein